MRLIGGDQEGKVIMGDDGFLTLYGQCILKSGLACKNIRRLLRIREKFAEAWLISGMARVSIKILTCAINGSGLGGEMITSLLTPVVMSLGYLFEVTQLRSILKSFSEAIDLGSIPYLIGDAINRLSHRWHCPWHGNL